jgi:4a-hydroxytetrahydrobiopterin dehydratase
MNDLAGRQCNADAQLLDSKQTAHYLSWLAPQWELAADGKAISRVFSFANYYETIAFVNLVASVAHRQDHHPELNVSYNHCRVEYSTHSAGGLTDNDCICAAKIDKMLHI